MRPSQFQPDVQS